MNGTNAKSLERWNPDEQAAAIRRALTCGQSGCSDQKPQGKIHCPAHDDSDPSLSLTVSGTKILLKCHAGCSYLDIAQALENKGLHPRPSTTHQDLSLTTGFGAPTKSANSTARVPKDQTTPLKNGDNASKNGSEKGSAKSITIERVYGYRDGNGKLLFEVVRRESHRGKQIHQRRPHSEGGYINGLNEGWFVRRGRDWHRAPHRASHQTPKTAVGQTSQPLNEGGPSGPPPAEGAVWFDAVSPVLYNLDAFKQAKLVFVAEGEKCADLLNIALKKAGVAAVATTNPAGAGKWRPEFSADLAERDVVILPDHDKPGEQHALQVAQSVAPVVTSLKIVALPGLSPKGDIVDYLEEGHSIAELMELVEEAPEWEPKTDTNRASFSLDADHLPDISLPSVDGLPSIQTNNRQLRWKIADARSAIVASNEPPHLFQFGDQLVRLKSDTLGWADTTIVTEAMTWELLTREANWFNVSKVGNLSHVSPPTEIARALMARGDWPGMPHLKGLISAPVLTLNGSVPTVPGYNAASGLYLTGPPLSIGDTTPTAQNVAAALQLLINEALGEFPFVDAASRAHALALMFLPFVRLHINGPTPLHLFDAPAAGTGKSLLMETLLFPFLGRLPDVMTLSNAAEEGRKRLTSALVKTPAYLCLDNVTKIDSPDLAAALTAGNWTDRLIGSSRMISVPVTCVWCATGNNVEVSGEIARRTVLIRLDAQQDKPYTRGGFRIPDLRRWAQENRSDLVTAILVILQSWQKNGCPLYHGTPTAPGSFEAWAAVMGGILGNAGIEGFLGNPRHFYERAEPRSGAWPGFLTAWHQKFGNRSVGVKDVLSLAILWIDEELGEKEGRSQAIRLGQALNKNADRFYGSLQLVRDGERTGAAQFRVVHPND